MLQCVVTMLHWCLLCRDFNALVFHITYTGFPNHLRKMKKIFREYNEKYICGYIWKGCWIIHVCTHACKICTVCCNIYFTVKTIWSCGWLCLVIYLQFTVDTYDITKCFDKLLTTTKHGGHKSKSWKNWSLSFFCNIGCT